MSFQLQFQLQQNNDLNVLLLFFAHLLATLMLFIVIVIKAVDLQI